MRAALPRDRRSLRRGTCRGPGAIRRVHLAPAPDLREEDGVVYASRPVALRREGDRIVIERIRETVYPDGARTEELDVAVLAELDVATLEAEMRAAGFETLPARHIAPTREHVGSWVVMGRA